MSRNITYNTIKIFQNKIFKEKIKKNDSVEIPFNFKDFLIGKPDENNIPLIPTTYFNKDPFGDNIGSKIINNYYL